MLGALASVVEANYGVVAGFGFLGSRDHLLDSRADGLGFGESGFYASMLDERSA